MNLPSLEAVQAIARTAGFDDSGVCNLEPIERDALARWLAAGYAATMGYMGRQARRRGHPANIVPGARRAVVVVKNYLRGAAGPSPSGSARVARYARSEDYHRVVGDSLRVIAEALIGLGSDPSLTRPYVDAGPVPERELAQRAGLGWIAKNTMLIHPRLGSYTFLGAVFTDLPLPTSTPFPTDHCGRCRRCLEACPTDAFPSERVLDARRCISYLTIERRGPFDDADARRIGTWLFGCDVCQEVCPWNLKFAPQATEARFAPRPGLLDPAADDFATIDEARFERTFGDTALARCGATGLRRNAAAVQRNLRGAEE